jgi:uncharacterized membrane protein YebE (DUF533 family)
MAGDVFDAWVRESINGAPPSPLTDAGAAAGAEQLAVEIYRRWCAAVGDDHRGESEWLAEVSHSLQRAARVLGPAYVIG